MAASKATSISLCASSQGARAALESLRVTLATAFKAAFPQGSGALVPTEALLQASAREGPQCREPHRTEGRKEGDMQPSAPD